MSVADLKTILADIPGIQNLKMELLGGRQVFSWGTGLIAAVDPLASTDEIATTIRNAAKLPSVAAIPANNPPADEGKEGPATVTAGPSSTPLPVVNISDPKPMTATVPAKGSFAASLRAMMDEAKSGVEQARADGLAKVGSAVAKLGEAKAAVTQVSGSLAKTIEDEAASVMAELGQFSNFPPE